MNSRRMVISKRGRQVIPEKALDAFAQIEELVKSEAPHILGQVGRIIHEMAAFPEADEQAEAAAEKQAKMKPKPNGASA